MSRVRASHGRPDRRRREGRVSLDQLGGVAERSNAAVSKTVTRHSAGREFESPPLRLASRPATPSAGRDRPAELLPPWPYDPLPGWLRPTGVRQRPVMRAIVSRPRERCPSWPKERDWKSRTCRKAGRGFESRPLRYFSAGNLRFSAACRDDRSRPPDRVMKKRATALTIGDASLRRSPHAASPTCSRFRSRDRVHHVAGVRHPGHERSCSDPDLDAVNTGESGPRPTSVQRSYGANRDFACSAGGLSGRPRPAEKGLPAEKPGRREVLSLAPGAAERASPVRTVFPHGLVKDRALSGVRRLRGPVAPGRKGPPTEQARWAQLGLNQRPLACEASALPLSYAPSAREVI